MLILQTPKINKRKWCYRVLALILFVGLLISGLYQNILDHTKQEDKSLRCTLSNYEKLCQAKCYCNFAMSGYENTTYHNNCKEYQICHAYDFTDHAQTNDYGSTSAGCNDLKNAVAS